MAPSTNDLISKNLDLVTSLYSHDIILVLF